MDLTSERGGVITAAGLEGQLTRDEHVGRPVAAPHVVHLPPAHTRAHGRRPLAQAQGSRQGQSQRTARHIALDGHLFLTRGFLFQGKIGTVNTSFLGKSHYSASRLKGQQFSLIKLAMQTEL